MTTINKLKNGWFSNDTSSLDGTYNKVSILNEGKTELKGDTLINSKLAINKNIDSTNDYKLDVSGNINFSGSLYQNNALFTSGITQTFADGRYPILSNSNTFTSQNTFTNGILPRAPNSASDIQIGNNQLQYRQATSTNNISIGALALQGDSDPSWTQYNTGKRNIGIGDNVLQRLDLGNDNIFLGYQAGQNCGSARIYGIGITPQRCIAIGTYSQQGNLYANDSVSIGYNTLKNASGPAPSNCMIGSNVGNGLTFQGNCTFIGSGCAPTVNDNGITCIGYQALGSAQNQFNSGTAIGTQAGFNNNNGQGGTFIGAEAGFTNTSGSNNTCIGLKAGRPSGPTLNQTVCIGYNSGAQINNECVFGGEAITEQVLLTLPQKHRISCNQSPTGSTLGISFRSNQNVLITDNTTTTINLPTPNATGVNQGAKFYIIRQTSTNNITINAPSGQTIGFYNASGIYTTASNYVMTNSLNNLALLCVANSGTSWVVINQLFLTTNITSNLTANSLTITPTQLSYLNGVTSAIQTQLNSKLGTTVTQNITANSLTITPQQLSFLNKVLEPPSLNAGLIPKIAISNYTDFLQYNVNASITGIYTFTTNPTFNAGSIPVSVLSNINDEYVDRSTSQDINGTKTFTSPPIMSGAFIEAGTIPGSAIDSFDLTEVISALLPGLLPASIDTTNFVDKTTDQTIGGAKTFSFPPTLTGTYITGIPLTAIPNLGANFARKNVDQTITGIYTFSDNPIFNANAILDSYLSTNVNNSIANANTFMNEYNIYIDFVSNIAGDTMNFINCNPKLTAGYNLDITGANIIANGTTISDVKVSFLNQVDASNKIPTSAIDGYGSGYLTISSASTTYQLQANMSSYQTISGMSNYASITGLSKLGGSINVMGGSYSLNFGDNRYLIMDNYPIITSIGLPSPTSSDNLGAVFSIVNKMGVPPNRSVSAPAGQTIYDFNTGTNASSIVIKDIGVIEFVCVGVSPTNTTTWAVLNRDDNVLKSGNQTIAGVKTFSSAPVMSGASITAGTIPYTAINSSYTANSVATLATSADVTLSSPLNNYYTFTSGASATTITLPLITTQIIGCPLTFRRVGNATSALNIKTPASSATTIIQRASIAETAQNTNYTFLATNQFIGTVMAISLTKWSVVS